LQRIGALYAIEADIRGQTAEQRQQVRQQRSRPLVEAMHAWLTDLLGRLSGRSTLAQAIRYALNHWKGLVRFLDDGRFELDTNIVERAMRPIALGRKNALFAGADVGASYCSSGDVLIKKRNFATNHQISVGVTAWPRRRNERHPAVGRRAGLSRALLDRAAEREARRG
jgi:transposase